MMIEHRRRRDLPLADSPLRIAVLVGERCLSGGELLFLERIRADSRFHLAAILTADTTGPVAPRPGEMNGVITPSLFSLLIAAERRFRAAERVPPQRDASIFQAGVDRIRIAFQTKGGCLADQDFQRIRALRLDVILDLTGTPAAPLLAATARFGVWSLGYGDSMAFDSQSPGFRGVCDGRGVTRVTLLQCGPGPVEKKTIASAFFPTRTTYTSSIEAARESALELIRRELGNVQRTGCLTPTPPAGDRIDTVPAPGIGQIAGYGSRLGAAFFKSVRKKVAAKLGIETDRWSLYVGTGRYETAEWSQAVETCPPSGEYWADPFLFRRKGETETQVFFEAFDYGTGKGKISVGSVSGNRIVRLGDALNTNYHLSYPFVFEYGDDIWMIPESHETRRLELWKCVDYPFGWKLEKTVMEGQSLADSSICRLHGEWWLFTNRAGRDAHDHNSELHVYRVDSPMMNEIVPHEANPVLIDARRARNGGRIHRKSDFLMRPAQNNAFRYGYGLGVYRIKTLTLETYEEEPFFSIEPNFRPGITCCHHLDTNGEIFVFDARRKFG